MYLEKNITLYWSVLHSPCLNVVANTKVSEHGMGTILWVGNQCMFRGLMPSMTFNLLNQTVHRDCLFCSHYGPIPQQSANHCSWHTSFLPLNGEWGFRTLGIKSELSCKPKLATMRLFPCHSVYLEFALHMLWVYVLFIYSLKSH